MRHVTMGRGVHCVSMHYRLSTQFNWYAQPIAEFLIGNFEQVILNFYARRAEAKVLQANGRQTL